MSNIKGTALVTGASTGIGAIYAERLARQGYDLVLVARNAVRLAALADRLHAETGRRVEPLVADLADRSDLARVEDRLRSDLTITMLVNNAGVGATAPLFQSDADAMSALVALNVEALMRLSYAAAPGFAAREEGTIVNIASIVAIAPEILNGVYGASKAFVLALSQSLRHELADSGVRVQVVLPGATATDFWALSGTPVEHLPPEIVISADQLVDAALAGLAQGEFVTIPTLANIEQWDAYEAARQAMIGNLSTNRPADRYGLN